MSLIEETRRDMYRALSYVPKSAASGTFESAMEAHLNALHDEIRKLRLANQCAGEALREKVESLPPISEEGMRILNVVGRSLMAGNATDPVARFANEVEYEFGWRPEGL